KESHVRDTFFKCRFSSAPDPVALVIDADKITLRKQFCQVDGIFSLATGQLQYKGLLITKVFGCPMTLHRLTRLKLQYVSERVDFRKLPKFIFSHISKASIAGLLPSQTSTQK